MPSLAASQRDRPLARAADCARPASALGVKRVVEIDTAGGPIYGTVSRFVTEPRFLGPREVVLTFDDGPAPSITNPVLATLDAFCTKATFFMVGRMALAYPDTVREVMLRGHTVAAHTLSHPLSLNRIAARSAIDEIEHGFAAITLAAGRPIAPFFRFPGLGDGKLLLTYLKGRGIGTISVDVVSDDSFIASTERLIKTTLARIEQKNGGIVLFHDIKPQTARALPVILGELKARGYSVVHMRAAAGYRPLPTSIASLQQQLAGQKSSRGQRLSLPAVSSQNEAEPAARDSAQAPPVTVLSPTAKPLVVAAHKTGHVIRDAGPRSLTPKAHQASPVARTQRSRSPSAAGSWSTSVSRSPE